MLQGGEGEKLAAHKSCEKGLVLTKNSHHARPSAALAEANKGPNRINLLRILHRRHEASENPPSKF